MDSALSRPDGCCKGESGQVRIKTAAKAPTRRSPGGQVAQSVEQKTENLRVECSIHSLPTKKPLTIKPFLASDLASVILGARLGASEHTSMLEFVVTSLPG
jgi:hypothetical protein